MTVTTGTRMTAAEYLKLPEQNTPIELLDGEVIVSPSPSPEHHDTVGGIYSLLKEISRTKGGKVYFAPLDVKLDEINVAQPDVIWLAPGSRCIVEEKNLVGPPELVPRYCRQGASSATGGENSGSTNGAASANIGLSIRAIR